MYEEDGCNNVNVSNGCRNVDRMRGIELLLSVKLQTSMSRNIPIYPLKLFLRHWKMPIIKSHRC